MRYTYALSALRHKRARLAGEIITAERATDKLRETLAALDATLRLFHPDADPSRLTPIKARSKWRNLWFRQGEPARLCLEALRDAGAPRTTRQIAEYLMRAKHLDVNDKPLRARMTEHARGTMRRQEAKGSVRRILDEPEVWWEPIDPLTGA
jgi:hypothetical protein